MKILKKMKLCGMAALAFLGVTGAADAADEVKALRFFPEPQWSAEESSGKAVLSGRPVNAYAVDNVQVFKGPDFTMTVPHTQWTVKPREAGKEGCAWIFVLDVSDRGNRHSSIEQEKKDAMALLSLLPDGDSVTIYAVEKENVLVANDLTPPQALLKLKGDRLQQARLQLGKTYLYSNLAEIVRTFSTKDRKFENKAVVVFSDGKEELPSVSAIVHKDEFVKALQKEGVVFYNIGYVEKKKDIPYTYELQNVAERSGGISCLVNRAVSGILSEGNRKIIAGSLRLAGHVSADLSGVTPDQSVRVVVKDADGRKWTKEYKKADIAQFAAITPIKPGLPSQDADKAAAGAAPGLREIENKVSELAVKLDSLSELGNDEGKLPEAEKAAFQKLSSDRERLLGEIAAKVKAYALLPEDERKAQWNARQESLGEVSLLSRAVYGCVLEMIDKAVADPGALTPEWVLQKIQNMMEAVRSEEETRRNSLVLVENQDPLMSQDEERSAYFPWMIGGGAALFIAIGVILMMMISKGGGQRACLTVGDYRNTQYIIKSKVTRIGKGRSNDCIIPNDSISREHCVIQSLGNGRWSIRDMHSSNGVYVNGKKVESGEIYSGDIIELGEVSVTFSVLKK